MRSLPSGRYCARFGECFDEVVLFINNNKQIADVQIAQFTVADAFVALRLKFSV